MSSSGMGRNAHFLMLSKAFPLPTTELPTLQGALRDGFGEAVVVCDMLEPCKFPTHQKECCEVKSVHRILTPGKSAKGQLAKSGSNY